jgi:hypothetical protein
MLNDLFIPLATGVFSYFVINWIFARDLRQALPQMWQVSVSMQLS